MSNETFLRTSAAIAAAFALFLASTANAEMYGAIDAGQTKKVKELVAAGADVNAPIGSEGRALPLNLAAQLDKPEIVEFLITSGASLVKADKAGLTPLAGAVSAGSVEVLNILLTSGLEINEANVDSVTQWARPALTAILQQVLNGAQPPFDPSAIEFEVGQTPELIEAVQVRLAILGYFRGEYDGVSSDALTAALARVSADAGIETDGTISPELLSVLYTSATVVCGSGEAVAETNMFWSLAAMSRNGCMPGQGAAHWITAISEIESGLIPPFSSPCNKGNDPLELPDASQYSNPWQGVKGKFEVGPFRVDGCAALGPSGYLFGAGSRIEFIGDQAN